MRSYEFIKESCVGQASPVGSDVKKVKKSTPKEKVEQIAKELKKVKSHK